MRISRAHQEFATALARKARQSAVALHCTSIDPFDLYPRS
jgi:hypothetical protein